MHGYNNFPFMRGCENPFVRSSPALHPPSESKFIAEREIFCWRATTRKKRGKRKCHQTGFYEEMGGQRRDSVLSVLVDAHARGGVKEASSLRH